MRTIYTVLLLSCYLHVIGQSPSYLPEGLHKLTKTELKERPLTLRGVPFYLEGKVVSKRKLGDLVTSADYALDYYGDKHGKIKAVVIRNANVVEEKAKKELIPAPRNPIDWRGREAPLFERVDLDSNIVSLPALKGKVVVLAFWYTNCQSCIREMDVLNQMVALYKGQEVVFLAPTKDIAPKVKKFLKDQRFSFTVLPNANSLGRRYGVMVYPMYFIIDQAGTVQFCQYQASSHTFETLTTQIDLLLK